VRATAALFLIPTDLTRTQFLEHGFSRCSCIWCDNWPKHSEFQQQLASIDRDIRIAKRSYETEWTRIHEAQNRCLESLRFKRLLQEQNFK
jgi:hypothetical protein